MKRILAIGGLAVAASSASYAMLIAFEAAEERHRASVEATFEMVGRAARPAHAIGGMDPTPDDALAWENVRDLQVSDVR
jgi:hypothetical protein